MTDFRKILSVLVTNKIEFILVGGAAATVHGSSRLTTDVDIVYSRRSENIERIVKALAPYSPYLRGAPPGLPFLWDAQTVKNGLNFTLTTQLGPLDLLGEITGGGSYEQLKSRSSYLDAFGMKCLCIDLKDLIHVKRAAGRPKDFEAIAELEAIAEEMEKQKK